MSRSCPRRKGVVARGPVAFVLSGGGSLGAVQVEMLQALTKSGIRPDLLIGASVGAVNAAWMAGQPDHDGAMKLGEIWLGLRRHHIFPFSLGPACEACSAAAPFHLQRRLSFRSVLEKHLPYEVLEDAAVPVHIITTDLRTGRAVTISSGPRSRRCSPAPPSPECFRR